MSEVYKHVGYAYATSDLARRFDKAETGCHFVETCHNDGTAVSIDGPYDDIAAAEAAADALEHEWWPLYQRFPMGGSRFARPQQAGAAA